MSEDSSPVDMFTSARDAQWSAQTVMGDDAVKLVAPAKVNLFLDVGERNNDGYHDVTTVLHALTLHDVMYVYCESDAVDLEDELPFFQALGGPEENILVSIDCADKTGGFYTSAGALDIPACDNIVFKAVDAYAKALGHTQPERVSIRLEKSIPYEAGLGGGSSDAAAALLAMAYFWDEDPQGQTLIEVARTLGSDVPFFLQGGCAFCDGSGSTIDHTLQTMKNAVVLVKPAVGVSTSDAYQAFDHMDDNSMDMSVDEVAHVRDACEVPLRNNLAFASESLVPELSEVRQWLEQQIGVRSADDVLLCGSGSATFAITRDFNAACDIAGQARVRGWWATATMFSSLRAARLQ